VTRFKGLKTGFNKTGSNDCCPNMNGPPATKFGGRPAVPAGPLKRYPGATADISGGNRRLAKSNHGDGGGSGTSFSTTGGNAFGRGGRK
jgi:hypothetical protein